MFGKRETVPTSVTAGTSIKFMTYNVWSCEHVAVYQRIRAICEIIERHDPDVIFLQEVTDHIHCLFQEAPWWGNYAEFTSKEDEYQRRHTLPMTSHSKPFCLLLSKLHATKVVLPGSSPTSSRLSKLHDLNEMVVVLAKSPNYAPSSPKVSPPSPPRPREPDAPSDLLSAWETKHRWHHRLRAATCSLAGPTPSDAGSVRRRARARAFLKYFDAVHHFDVAAHQQQQGTGSAVLDENIVLGGDLGWDDDLDGPLRLGDGWVDAWAELRGCGGGWTYDAVANPMVSGLKNRHSGTALPYSQGRVTCEYISLSGRLGSNVTCSSR